MTAHVPELESYVAGSWHRGAAAVDDRNPARPAEVVALTFQADAELAAEAVEAAFEASARWRETSAPARGDVLRKAGDLLDERVAEVARGLTREEGKTIAESSREVRLAAKIFRYYSGLTLDADGETYPSHQEDMLLFTRREPVGVVSVVTPWNFPISLPAWKLAAALAYGNTVVWKPAELVPMTSVHLTRALVDVGLPEGVLNLVLGKGSAVGDVLATHPRVAAVTFTGSTQVGRVVQAAATAQGKKVQLELGGKNPAIVMSDADLELAADEISVGAFGATGQKCTATSRVICARPVLEPLVELLRERADRWRLGDPLDPDTTLGPLASAEQLDGVLGHVDVARRDGARVVTGGTRADGAVADGYFVRPAVLTDIDPAHPVVREEIFGPVAVVLAADSYEEAMSMANDTPYGLSASLFTGDLSTTLRFVRDSRTGLVRVNRGTSGMEYHVPFGGMKDSGYGHRELGKAARDFFTESKTVYIAQA